MSTISINSNISSLNTQRSLSTANKKLADTYTRLSSGLRINKAVDDAAGLAISENLKADTKILNQGTRNLNDGLSLLAIADGAVSELSSIMIRLSELAEQSSNGTQSNKQRNALDQEAQSLSAEYTRIARTAEFNGRKIFNADFGELSLAAGGNAASVLSDGLGGGIGDGTFTERITYATAGTTADITIFDINNDGYQDLLSLQNGQGISIMLGNSDGTFSSRISYGGLISGTEMALSDLNGDGETDIALTDSANDNVSIFFGNSNGSFKSAISYFSDNANGLTLADLNGDGIQDIATANGTFVNVLIGNSNGSFASGISYAATSNANQIRSADFDGDGVFDLVTPDFNAVNVFKGNNNGTFKTRDAYSSSSTLGVELGDFNRDGIIDILSTPSAGPVSVFFGNSNGTLNARSSYVTLVSPRKNRIADFNGDGLLDIVSLSFTGNGIGIALNNGDGTFSLGVSYTTATSVGTGLAVKDINDDGAVDVIAGTSGATMNVFLGNSEEGISALQQFSLRTKFDSRVSLTYFKSTLNKLGEQRGQIGAFQSRLDAATNVLKQSALAYNEANSRITDTDVAEESARLVALQILQKSSTSILAQSNQQPKITLQLLEGI